ncbi:MAG: hypothetical protein FWE71_04725 [Nocardioidaceae bacterium]|nr:hypothetical protein [Nocardioidaceae bacterium]MCL2612067.1 hypothetical protein [Nocardioidaceae bacterium]
MKRIGPFFGWLAAVVVVALPLTMLGLSVQSYLQRGDATATVSGTVVRYVTSGYRSSTTTYDLKTASGSQYEIDMPAWGGGSGGDVRDLDARVGQSSVATVRDGQVVRLRFADGRVLRTTVGTARSIVGSAALSVFVVALVALFVSSGPTLRTKRKDARKLRPSEVRAAKASGIAMGAAALFGIPYYLGASWWVAAIFVPVGFAVGYGLWRLLRSDRWAARRRARRSQAPGGHVKVD